jgi:hypothetical protein
MQPNFAHRPDFKTLKPTTPNDFTVVILAACVCDDTRCYWTGTLYEDGAGAWNRWSGSSGTRANEIAPN